MDRPRVWAEINLNRVADNLKACRQHTGPCKILGVVKADAYGHGAGPIARTMEQQGVDMLGVGDSHEAIQLRDWGIQCPLLVLGAVIESEIDDLIRHRIRPTLHSPERIELINRKARDQGVVLPVHLMVDTGMGLLGICPTSVIERVQQILECKNLQLEGLGSHFASPLADEQFSELQIERFVNVVTELEKHPLPIPIQHMSASSAMLRYPSAHFDMVRLGGLLYGLERCPNLLNLKPVLSLHSQIAHIKDLPPDRPVSYEGTYVTDGPTRIATLPIGYHDGYLTHLSNKAKVIIRGQFAPVIGRVTMDYTLVDITHIRNTQVGDQATLLGSPDSNPQSPSISAQELAGWANTNTYSIPSHLGPRVQRIYRGQAAPEQPQNMQKLLRRSQRLDRMEFLKP